MGKNYWMVVQTRENFEISRRMGFTVHGLRKKQRRRADRMRPEDKVLFYISDLRKWAVVATITSRYFEDRSSVWVPSPRGERFPFRVSLRPDIMLDEESFVDGLQLGPRLEYVKRWAPEDWPLAFVDTLHLIPQRDFRLIEGEMRRITRTGRKSGVNGRQRRVEDGLDAGRPVDETDGDLSDADRDLDAVIPEAEAVAIADQDTGARNDRPPVMSDDPGDTVEGAEAIDAAEAPGPESPEGNSGQPTAAEPSGPDDSGDTVAGADMIDTPEIHASESPDGDPGQPMSTEAGGPEADTPTAPDDDADSSDTAKALTAEPQNV